MLKIFVKEIKKPLTPIDLKPVRNANKKLLNKLRCIIHKLYFSDSISTIKRKYIINQHNIFSKLV
jgi:hypothetical protein